MNESSTIYVSPNDDLNVFGNDLLSKFNLWNIPFNDFCSNEKIFQINTENNYTEFLKSNFTSCFEKSLGKCINFKAHLTLKPNTYPPFIKFRPPPFAFQSLIETELKRLQKLDVISPVTISNCAAPIVSKLKKTGEIRICADFSTGLNENLENHRYPLPLPGDIFAKLNGSTIFSHIDLSDAFLQIEMDDESKNLLVINTHVGLFKYNRLTFGIKTAPTIFQEVMDQLIAPLKNIICYMDDIFVFGKIKREHDDALFSLMKRIQEFGFHIKLEKSKFAFSEIKNLGSIVNKNGIKTNSNRIKAINDMIPPSNLTELRSFLGSINFYNKFIKNIFKLRAPLEELLHKNIEWKWTKTHQQSFNQLKKALTSELLLTHYNPKLDLIVSADASNKGLGASIQHLMSDHSIRPIAFASRTLQPAEQKYSQIEKEGLALIFAVKKFHKFIFGRKFILETDHKPLLAIFGSKKGIPIHTASRLQRWAVILLGYNFEIKYINTSSFAYVDVLSRLITQHPHNSEEDYVVASIKLESKILQVINSNLQNSPINYKILLQEYSTDTLLQNLIVQITSNWENFSNSSDPDLKILHSRRDSLSISNQIILYGNRIVIPSTLRDKIIRELQPPRCSSNEKPS